MHHPPHRTGTQLSTELMIEASLYQFQLASNEQRSLMMMPSSKFLLVLLFPCDKNPNDEIVVTFSTGCFGLILFLIYPGHYCQGDSDTEYFPI